MTRTGTLSQPFHLVTEQPAPRFLGLPADERNQRLANRLSKTDAPHDAALPTLTIPSGAIITPTDGWLSRHIHRKISRLFSYAFLQMGLSANAATLFTFLVGAVTGWLMAQTTRSTMIAGAALFWFASVADGIDGEMARLTFSDSQRGEQIDSVVDVATYIVAFAG